MWGLWMWEASPVVRCCVGLGGGGYLFGESFLAELMIHAGRADQFGDIHDRTRTALARRRWAESAVARLRMTRASIIALPRKQSSSISMGSLSKVESASAMTEAERGPLSTMAISPNKAPGWVCSASAISSSPIRMDTRPSTRTYKASPGTPTRMMRCRLRARIQACRDRSCARSLPALPQ